MAIEIVPAHDERCDVCAGQKERERPKPGERWSVREVVHTMCEACFKDYRRDLEIGKRLDDRVTRDIAPPDDPGQN